MCCIDVLSLMPTLAIWMLYRHPFGLSRLSGFWLIWIRHDLVGSSIVWWWNWLVHDTHAHIWLVGFGLVMDTILFAYKLSFWFRQGFHRQSFWWRSLMNYISGLGVASAGDHVQDLVDGDHCCSVWMYTGSRLI